MFFCNETAEKYRVSLSFLPQDTTIISVMIIFGIFIVAIIWQIISYFWQKKLQKTWNKKTIRIRKITKFYYLILAFCLILSQFNIQNLIDIPIPKISSGIIGALIIYTLPLFWIIYYTDLLTTQID